MGIDDFRWKTAQSQHSLALVAVCIISNKTLAIVKAEAKAVCFAVVIRFVFVFVFRKLEAKTKCDLNLLRLWPAGKVKKIKRLEFLEALDYYLLTRK